jgi:hypothetical protein
MTWHAYRVRRTHAYVFYLLIFGMSLGSVALALFAQDHWQEWQPYLPYAGIVVAVAFVALMPLLIGSKGKPVALTLEGHHLVVAGARRTRRFNLTTSKVSFGRHYAAKNYAYFTGTVMTLRASSDNERLRILGGGAELPERPVTDPDTHGNDYDLHLDSEGFHALVDAVGAVAGIDGSSQSPAASGPRRFAAFPTVRGANLKIMLFWIGGASAIGLGTSFLITSQSPIMVSETMPFVAGGSILLLLLLVIRLGSKAYAKKGHLLIDGDSIALGVKGRDRHLFRGQTTAVRPFHVEVSTRYGRYYSGPAVELRSRGGRKAVVVISDQKRTWRAPEKTVARVDYTVGIDAGNALLDWLRENTNFRAEFEHQ